MLLSPSAPNAFIHTMNLRTLNNFPTRHSRSPHFFSLERGDSLKIILSRPYDTLIEISQRDDIEFLLDSLFEDSPDLSISLTTQTCYKNNTAICIAEMLSERFGLLESKKIDVSTCLQEAIMNAILHGNLNISSNFHSIKSFEKHQEGIEKRLSKNHYKDKRIHISAWDTHKGIKISVRDEGSGFSLNCEQQKDGTPHGRGLMFIKTMANDMWLGDDKRTLFMNFSY
jgi:anti-sigma regulatory factor (Ser/Thr protein kinase)